MGTLLLGGQRLAYTRHTEGEEMLIFLHGIASCQHTWLDFPLRFREFGSIVTLSLPGHYPAAFAPDMQQKALTDAWVGDIMAQTIIKITDGKPATLIGHSTGGYTALAVAWRAPELVKGIITLGGFALGRWKSTLGIMQRLRYLGNPGKALFEKLMHTSCQRPATIDANWRACSYDKRGFTSSTAYASYRPHIMADIQKMDAKALRMWFFQMHRAGNLTPYLAKIQVPVLAIAGRQDNLVPPHQAELIGKHIAQGKSIILDQMGHSMFIEQPERVYQAMYEWLQTCNKASTKL